MALEQEIKLVYPSAEAARQAVTTAGGRLVVSRRLLDDQFFDTHDLRLRRDGQALRVRSDADRAVLTWKGPPQPGPVKSREEIEADCTDARDLAALLGALGYVPCFRSQKFREDYAIESAVVTVDETPFSVFVEVEAAPAVIADIVTRLGRSADDYELKSYVALWRHWCATHHLAFGDMMFDRVAASHPS